MTADLDSSNAGFQAADLSLRRPGHRRSFLVLVAISVLAPILLLATNLPWQLDDYDQGKQAYTSLEIVKEGNWLYQHTPLDRVATKPPLVAWISAALFSVTRSWAIAWRLPSFAATIALAVLLFRAGSIRGLTSGLLAVSAFIFNLLTVRLATLVRTDMPLALVTFTLGLLIWNKLRTHEQWSSRDRWLLFGLLTAGMLIKGPIVYAFLLPGIFILSLIRRRDVSRHVWGSWWPWLGSLFIFLIWSIGGSIFVPDFHDQVVVREFLGRFGETIHRPQPFFFYLPHLLHKFFPWSIFMIALAFVDLRAHKLDRFKRSSLPGGREANTSASNTRDGIIQACFKKIADAGAGIAPETLWLICWIVGGVIVMSIIPSKRVDRIFPVVPPLCLLLAAQIAATRSTLRRPAVLTYIVGLSVLWTCGYTITKVVSGYRDHRDALVVFGRTVRREVSRRHWRFDVVKSNDEGLLLYLEKTHFTDPTRAVDEWNRGNLEALVVSSAQAPDLMRLMHDVALSDVRSASRKNEARRYVLLVH